VRLCPKCNKVKTLTEFYSNRSECKDCKRQQTKKNYEETQEKRVSYSKERRNRMKLKAIKYKGGKCHDCGGEFHQACYDFHHMDSNEKASNVGSLMSASWDVVRKEIDKCVLLCSNCHRIRHFV
jgi:predicted HNH restriction endonuclease